MSLIEPVFVGVDPTSGRTSFTYAVLGRDLSLLALAEGELEDVVVFLKQQAAVVAAINSPSGTSRGLVEKRIKKEGSGRKSVRRGEMRLCEYELRSHGIAVSGTPSNIAACPAWMQLGFNLYRKLEKAGFSKYSQGESESSFQILESHPHAGFCVLADALPQPKPSIEGRLQRQLILYERGVRIQDPMDFFEEITRHKMIKGVWPAELLYLPEQLDALVAAYTAWIVFNKPDKVSAVGDAVEGKIYLPEKELKEKY